MVDEEGFEFQDERSPELASLISAMGGDYDYVIGSSGESQRIAILYDRTSVRLNEACEANFRRMRVNQKNVFDRQPLYAHFTFLEGDEDRNDLVIVGVHLASGQARARNHDRAMRDIQREIADAREVEFCIPNDEFDVVITCDFNANRFDQFREDFWDEMEEEGWDVLADSSEYPPTRLSGDPLGQRNSRIDYIIVSSNDEAIFGLLGHPGLAGEEVTAAEATVHDDLLSIGNDEFRVQASDHIPVTIEVSLIDDTD